MKSLLIFLKYRKEPIITLLLQKGYFLKDRLLRPAMVRGGHNPSFKDSDTKSPEEVRTTDDSSKSDPEHDA